MSILRSILRPTLPKRLFALGVALSMCAYGIYDALQPAKTVYRPVPDFDKVVHFTAFFGITILACYGLLAAEHIRARRRGELVSTLRFPMVFIWLGVTAFGCAIELIQLWSALGRVADVWDAVANAFGALLACVLFFVLETVQTRKMSSPTQ